MASQGTGNTLKSKRGFQL